MRTHLISLTLLSLACGGSDISVKAAGEARCNGVLDEEETTVDGPFDSDDDGFFDANNPGCEDTYPPEDLDCDDADPEVGGQAEWFPDADSDGFGTPGETTFACEAVIGFAASADDCDDTRGSTYPGADEYCDTRDNDCDDIIDENPVDGLTFYRDADGDSYGSADDTLTACDTPTGYSPSLGDCDDVSASVNPSVDEECFDDKDNNCDGEVDEGCNVEFSGSWNTDYPIEYSCNAGAVDINFETLTILEMSPSISFTSIGSTQPGTMSGTINPDGWEVYASTSFAGSCDEEYTLTGTFIDDASFEGTFQASFSGWGCADDCAPQVWAIELSR
jgi:hypothetical protein